LQTKVTNGYDPSSVSSFHFGEEELVYFPAAERNWSEAEKAEVWEKMQAFLRDESETQDTQNQQGGAER
jgi:hypothetical protein